MGLIAALSLARPMPWFLLSFIQDNQSTEHQRLLSDGADTAGKSAAWIGLTAVAVLMKLAASIDDVAWLLPFMASTRKWRNASFYLFCMQLVVFISWSFSFGGEQLLAQIVPDTEHWPLPRILELTSAILLTFYSIKLLWDWYKEKFQSDEENLVGNSGTSETNGKDHSKTPCEKSCTESGTAKPDNVANHHLAEEIGAASADAVVEEIYMESISPKAETTKAPIPCEPVVEAFSKQHSLCQLFTISMFGSLDDMAIFVSLMLSGVLSYGHLAVGVLVGSLIVVAVCVGVGLVGCIARTVEKIPLWCIIGTFAIWTYVSTFVLD